MAAIDESDLLPSGRLRERIKELRCLQGIVALIGTPGLPSHRILQGIVDLIPSGWQHPEHCRARITYRQAVFYTPGFAETRWCLRAPLRAKGAAVGGLDVCYDDNVPARREDPFLLEERKLIELVANRIGRLIEDWEDAGRPGPAAEAERRPGGKTEWQVIVDLLRETDPVLYKRILRRLMNHLHWQGVPGVQGLLLHFSPDLAPGGGKPDQDDNQPQPRQDVGALEKVFEEALWIASLALPDRELADLFKQWMRQDRLNFFSLATEKRDVSLVEIKEIVNRFCRSTREDEQALSRADDLQARIALTRRFLSERLAFIRIAKEHLTIHDFNRLLARVCGPSQGTGRLGGKAAGMVLASQILRKKSRLDPSVGDLKVPESWFIASDGLIDFIHYNFLEDLQSFKFSRLEEIRHNYPYLVQVCKQSFFSPEMLSQLTLILDAAGEGPLIVRSSSLLEDSRGTAFSGKYRSLFLANTGAREERLAALTDAVAEVYASIFNPDAIQYRAERGLLDYYEEMAVLVQKVVGTRVGRYFFPAFAGVAFGNNEIRWSPRIRREDGLLRLVTGLGTRAVDRTANDYPTLLSPGQPGLRVNVMPEEIAHYSQRAIDVIDLEARRFETRTIDEVLREIGPDFPLWEKIFSVYDGTAVRKAVRAIDHPDRDPLVVTFAGLVESTGFVRQMRAVMQALREEFGIPMDVEFAHDGRDLYILQCRPQSQIDEEDRIALPRNVAEDRVLFTARRHVPNGHVAGIRTIVYVDPLRYAELPSQAQMVAVGDAVSRLNALLPKRSFVLMGPGRWGSRGDIRLGVRVTYSDINNTAMLIEVARKVGSYVPDISFGTHFFQDLVEAGIRYLALYPDDSGIAFAERFFRESPNLLAELLPESEPLSDVIRVIDVPAVTGGLELRVVMDAEEEAALGYLAEPPPAKGA